MCKFWDQFPVFTNHSLANYHRSNGYFYLCFHVATPIQFSVKIDSQIFKVLNILNFLPFKIMSVFSYLCLLEETIALVFHVEKEIILFCPFVKKIYTNLHMSY